MPFYTFNVTGTQGPTGTTGPTGATGPIGTTGATGLVGVWKGQWVTTSSYTTNNFVYNVGNAFICIVAHNSTASNQPPTGAEYSTVWGYVAMSGTSGVVGATGPTGATGVVGPSGGPVPTGGTPNQIIVKVSTTDFDVVWAANPAYTGGKTIGDL